MTILNFLGARLILGNPDVKHTNLTFFRTANIDMLKFIENKINYILNTITVLGLGATLYYGWSARVISNNKKTIDWKKVKSIVNKSLKQVEKDNFQVEVILAPGTRGSILAELILTKFNREIPAVVGISYIEHTQKQMPDMNQYVSFEIDKKWSIFIPTAIRDFRDLNILIVDDFCFTGEFFLKLKKHLISMGFKESKIKVFCAVITKVTVAGNKTPDYYGLITDDDNFYFPWGKANTG